jgi:TonB-linked SusC/RagA family outer membrane protein
MAQPITISVKNTRLKNVFEIIESQSEVRFFYRLEALDKANRVTIHVSNVNLSEALERCFQDQPLTYEMIDKTIVVKEKPLNASEGGTVQATTFGFIAVSGRVITLEEEPVAGATISIKGTQLATSTSSKGEFSIQVPNAGAVLEVTSVGIAPMEVPITKRLNLTIRVATKIGALDHVQVIGYGQTTKRLNTGNITTIKAIELERQPVGNILAALEGRVPGMFITQNTGLTGGSYSVNIRGISSLLANSDPLYIVDGIPYPSGTYFLNNDFKQGGQGLNMINNGDIERVDVLKDADATAIYGSRGGNGVILITTKKAMQGKTTIDLNMYNGFGKVTTRPKLLNTQQYLQMRRESNNNDGYPLDYGDESMNGTWDTSRYTNWSKELLGGTAQITDAQLSISGGSNILYYSINGGYHRETTVMPVDGSNKRYSVHFHLGNVAAEKKLKLELTGSYQAGEDDLPAVDFTSQVILMTPTQPPSFLPDGSLNYDPSIRFNPYIKLKELYKLTSGNLLSHLKISWAPVKALELSTSFGYHLQTVNDFYGIPTTVLGSGYATRADYSTNTIQTFIAEPQVFYRLNLKRKGKISALLGTTYQKSLNSFQNLNGSGFSNDALLGNPAAAAVLIMDRYQHATYKYIGTFSRLSYNLDNKYLLNVTGRVDGTSRVGPGKQ